MGKDEGNEIMRMLEEEMGEEMGNLDGSSEHSSPSVSLISPPSSPVNIKKEDNLHVEASKIVMVAALCTFFATICPVVYLPVIPLIQSDFKATNFEMTLSIFSFTIVCGFSPIIHGQISDYFGRKIALLPNLTMFFGTILIAGSSLNIWMLILSRSLMALFSSGFTTFCTSMIADVVPPAKRATAVSKSMMVSTVGNIIGGPLAGLISDYFGWRSTFYILLLPLFPLIIYIAFFVPETHKVQNDRPFRVDFIRPFKLILTNRKIAFAAIPNSLTFSAVLVLSSLSSLLIDRYYHFSSFVIGLLLANSSIGSLFGSIFGGKLSDFIRSKKGRGGSLLLAFICSVIVALVIILFGFSVPYTPLCFFLFLITGFFMITTRGIIFAYSTEDNRKETAAIVSALVCLQFLNVSVELLLSSILLDFISPAATFILISSSIFIALIPSAVLIKDEWPLPPPLRSSPINA